MAKIVGSVDERQRSLIRVQGSTDDLLLVVDSGFNGELLVSRAGATALGMVANGRSDEIELGDGSKAYVNVGGATIDWLGAQRLVKVFVSDVWRPKADDPVGLVGAGLISPHLLLIDYSERTVEIETVG